MLFNRNTFIQYAKQTVSSDTAKKYAKYIEWLQKKFQVDPNSSFITTSTQLEHIKALRTKSGLSNNYVSAWKKLIDWKGVTSSTIVEQNMSDSSNITTILATNIINLVKNNASVKTIEQHLQLSSKILSGVEK